MNVETYEVTETTASGVESEPEALALIESLGLTGQKKLIRGEGEAAVRCPYRLMSALEYRVYKQVLPDRVVLEDYAGQAIPLRVLQVAAHAQQLGMFKRLEVWHCEGKDDPLLIGSTQDHNWTAAHDHAYLLARWGEVLKPIKDLITEAKAIVAAKLANDANETLERIKTILAGPELVAEVYLRTGKTPNAVYFSVS